MKIAVIGTGYVGLVTGTCFADSGNDVTCIDKDARKIEMLERGEMPIYEPGLQELVQRNHRDGRLRFTTDLPKGIAPAQLVFVAVGTPQGDDGSADLSGVFAVADAVAAHLNGPKIVVIKSTVPVGTNRAVAERMAKRAAHAFDVASNPEFLKEGAAIEDCTKPDRVVVGVRRPEVGDVLHELYAPFLRTERPFLVMSPESAEMTKYVANAMLATKISFINEMANLCERMGANINDVRRGIGHDARIGFQFLFPGAGYGGSCFEADETVFVRDGETLRTRSLEEVFADTGRRSKVFALAGVGAVGPALQRFDGLAGVVEECGPAEPLKVLAFDLATSEPRLAEVHALTRRPYSGVMVRLTTSMGRTLRVTADHPVILWTADGSRIVRADEVRERDLVAVLTELPALPPLETLNLIDLLRDTELEADVHVSPTDDSFTAQYEAFVAHIPKETLRHPLEIKWNNRMPLRLYRRLTDLGVLDVPPEKLQLYTAKGAATKLNAVIPIDADLLRLCGYYLAEGYIALDLGRAGAVRERTGFSFHVAEKEYIADVRRILRRWGLKYIERISTNASTTLVSSRVFAWLLRDVLGCGVRSEDKRLPVFAFNAAEELRLELLRGAFSGDGSVTPVQNGRNFMLEYATVSKRLAHGLGLLLQSVGIVPSIRPRWMNKSKRPAYLVRVSGRQQLIALRDVFGGKQRERIDQLLSRYQSAIRQRGFSREGSVALLHVRRVEHELVETTVYSLETATGTVIAGSGLVCHNCFPKDIRAIIGMSRQAGGSTRIMQAVDDVNEAQKQVLVHKIRQHYGEKLAGKTLAVWGLAFKPRTDDIREAPSLVLIDAMLAAGVKLRVHDPEATANVKAIYGDKLVYCDKPYGALEEADGLAIVTEWKEFHNPDFEVMRRLLRERVIFDGRNLYDLEKPASYGFTYYSIGRTPAAAAK
jgi:UDPglucose 6-dehydrogenase